MSLKEEFDVRRVLDRLRMPQRLNSLEERTQSFFKARGVRSVNGVLPDDVGNVAVSTGATGVTQIFGTAHQIIASNPTGNVTLSTPQNIDTTSSPTFANLTLSNPLPVASGGTGQSSYTNGQLLIGNTTGNTLVKGTLTSTANQTVITNGAGTITVGTVQDINTTSSPTFSSLTLSNPLAVGSGGTGTGTYTNGQLLIGNGSSITKGTLTATANQTTITNGAGTITVGTVQNIGTGSAPTFAGMTMNGTITMDGVHTITNGITPVNASDYAIKSYVDAISSGIIPYAAVKYATVAALAANTYNNGASGVGATLTANANGAITIDGVTPSVNDRVLIKNEATQANNGVYTVTTVGDGSNPYVLTRATDFNTAAKIVKGAYFLVTAGNTLADSAWFQNLTVTTVGTDPINFVQFSQSSAYVAGNGINVTGLTISAVGEGTNITVTGSGIGFTANAMKGMNALSAATGQIPVGNAGTWNGLAVGANNTVVSSDGTNVSWAFPATLRRSIHQPAHGLSLGNVVAITPGAHVAAKANSGGNHVVVGIVTQVVGVDDFVLCYGGRIGSGVLSGLTTGQYYLSDTIAGGITTTAPTAPSFLVPCFIADSPTNGYITADPIALPFPIPVSQGGTSVATLTGVVLGNGTSAFTAVTIPADATQFLNGAATPAFAQVKDSDLSTSDITTNNVSSTKHGFAPKSISDATKFLNGAATPAYAQVKDSDIFISDITTNNVTTAAHGFTPKLPNDSSKFLDGTGSYSTPSGLVFNGIMQGRLTLTSGTPVTSADVTGATSIFFTPYNGDTIALYNGTTWNLFTFTEITIALGTLSSGLNYDLYAFVSGSTVTIDPPVAWSDNTTRVTQLTNQNGVKVKTGDATRRYIGTFRTTSTTTTEDSRGGVSTQTGGKRFLYNAYNRVMRDLQVIDKTNNWTYNTSAWRQSNATSGNRVEYVDGLGETTLVATAMSIIGNSNLLGQGAASGIGIDRTTANDARLTGVGTISNNTSTNQCSAYYTGLPGLGYHAVNWLEHAPGVDTTTWYGTAGLDFWDTGLVATIL